MITTLREYWLLVVFLLALAATVGLSYGKLLTRTIEESFVRMEARRR